jgi:hypothetical protein
VRRPTEAPGGDTARIDPSTARPLLDTMLGELLTYWRMCGYDAA